jgi:hypothetical protein
MADEQKSAIVQTGTTITDAELRERVKLPKRAGKVVQQTDDMRKLLAAERKLA